MMVYPKIKQKINITQGRAVPLVLDIQSHIRRISFSPLYLSNAAVPRWLHHSNSIELQMSLNHGVNLRPGSPNITFSSSAETYRVSRTSLGFSFRSTSAWIKRM